MFPSELQLARKIGILRFMQIHTLKTPSHWLAAELGERKSKNSRYSLRTFSSKVGIPPGRLSELVAGKRRMTIRQAEKIADRLNYSPSIKKQLLSVVKAQAGVRKSASTGAGQVSYEAISADIFQVIADWQHIAILSLLDTKDAKSDVRWIAGRLGISKPLVEGSIERLLRVGLLKIEDGLLTKTEKDLETSQDVVSPALRISHRQSLQQASDALDAIPVELRDITSISMAIDPSKIPHAKKLIKNFRRRLCQLLESGNQTEVFNLNIQLVPVTNFEKNFGESK